jgi:uncharacterized protein (UPF0262 family)
MTQPASPSKSSRRLVRVTLDEEALASPGPDADHERAVAIYDLIEENSFEPAGHDGGPYALHLTIADNRLVFDVRTEDDTPVVAHLLSLTPFRRIVKDYFMVCDSYHQAIRALSPSQIEAIDMGRRGLHNEGSELVVERLKGKIGVDFGTARRLFTLITALHWKG